MNYLVLQGNISKEPLLKDIKNGTETMCSFRLAVDRTFKSGNTQQTDHFSIACFGQLGKYAIKHLEKGSLVTVEGKLRQNRWIDVAGNQRTEVQIVADKIHHNQKPIHKRAYLPMTGVDELEEDAEEIVIKPEKTVSIDGRDIPDELLNINPAIEEQLKRMI